MDERIATCDDVGQRAARAHHDARRMIKVSATRGGDIKRSIKGIDARKVIGKKRSMCYKLARQAPSEKSSVEFKCSVKIDSSISDEMCRVVVESASRCENTYQPMQENEVGTKGGKTDHVFGISDDAVLDDVAHKFDFQKQILARHNAVCEQTSVGGEQNVARRAMNDVEGRAPPHLCSQPTRASISSAPSSGT